MRGISRSVHSAGRMKRNFYTHNPHSPHLNKLRCRLHAFENAKCEIIDTNDNYEIILFWGYKSNTSGLFVCLTLIRLQTTSTSSLTNSSTCLLYPSKQCSMSWTTTTANLSMRRKKFWTRFQRDVFLIKPVLRKNVCRILLTCFWINIRFIIALLVHYLSSAINYRDHLKNIFTAVLIVFKYSVYVMMTYVVYLTDRNSSCLCNHVSRYE